MKHPILMHYMRLTEFLGVALGPDYEVALHDLTDKNKSIIAISNGHISGRNIGAPLTNVALQILMDKSYEKADFKLHYMGLSTHNKTLRSSTWFIKDEGRLIGMMCINFDDSRFLKVSDQILGLCHPDKFIETHHIQEPSLEPALDGESTENFYDSINAVASDAVHRELNRLGLTAERLTAEERVQIITNLEAGGIFLLKGAVKDVAQSLRCSSASIYRYLSQLKEQS